MPRLSLFLLGSPRLVLDERVIDLSRRKAMALLAYLAVTKQRHSRDVLATLLWPDLDQSRARGALRRTLSVLNTTLGGASLDIERETVELNPETTIWIDVDQFQRLLAESRPDDNDDTGPLSPDGLADLEAAVALYEADFLAGFSLRDAPDFDEWQFFQTEKLRQSLAEALERLVVAQHQAQSYDAALSHARRWVALDPLHEPAQRHLMDLYARTGQRAAALRQYQLCVETLERELGLAPSPETTTLAEQIRAGEANSGAEMATVTSGNGHSKGNGRSQTPTLPLSHVPPFNLAPLSSHSPSPFVAREAELARLSASLEVAVGGQGRLVFITGEAGAGKTALVQAFARQAQAAHDTLIVALGEGNAHTGLGDPYLPFREILGLLTGEIESRWMRGAITRQNAQRLWQVLPHALATLVDLSPGLIDTFIPKATVTAWAARLKLESDLLTHLERLAASRAEGLDDLFEQYCHFLQAISRDHPLLLIIDDAQWVDAASVSLLFHLSRQLSGSRILLLVTYRPNEIALGRNGERHPLEPVINEIRRAQGQVHLDLDEAMSADFVDVFLDTEPNHLSRTFRQALYRRTQGHPLFTVELLRTLQERGDLIYREPEGWVESDDLDWAALPARVEAVIEERIGRLEPELREILAVASVEGEQFTAQVVTEVQGLDERHLLRRLSQLLEKRHHLVQESCEVQVGGHYLACYEFTHTLFQQYLYNTLSAGERRLLHGDVAQALERLYDAQDEEITVQLAHHYAAAGQTEKAVEYLLRAGDRARPLHAHQEAVDFYQQALELLKTQKADDRAARTLMKLGLTYHLAFNFQQSREAYREGFALWQRANVLPVPRPPAAPHPLRVTWPTPPSLDPSLADDDHSGILINQLFCGLVTLTPDMDVVPDLAHSWDVLDEGRRYIFHLRQDARWSDGQPVTAEDFVYAWRRVLDPAAGSSNPSYLFDIKGARAFNQGQTDDPAHVAVYAPDDVTLVVEMEAPSSYFPQLLSFWQFFPLPRQTIAAHGDAWTTADHIVTNGPFRLEEWLPGQSMTLRRNSDYRGAFTGNVDHIHIRLDVTGEETLDLYQRDALDLATHFGNVQESLLTIRHRFAADYILGPLLHIQYLCFNSHHPPFDDWRVRQALALAIDKESLFNIRMAGLASAATGGFIPPGLPEHSPGIGLPYDPDRARHLLAEAGYPQGRHFPGVIWMDKHRSRVEGRYLIQQWRDVLGIEVELEILPWADLLHRREQSPPPIFRLGWSADYPDPDNFLRAAIHSIGWENPTYLDLVERARRLPDPAERLRLYRQADKILIDEAVIVPLSYGQGHLLLKPWVSKYPTSPLNWYFWKDTVIERH